MDEIYVTAIGPPLREFRTAATSAFPEMATFPSARPLDTEQTKYSPRSCENFTR